MQSTGEIPQSPERTGRDGRTIDTTNIGKAAGQEGLATTAAKIMLDARRKTGDTLKLMKERGELDCGGDPESRRSHGATGVGLAELGLTKSQSSRYQLEASVPEEAEVVSSREAVSSGKTRAWWRS